VTLSGVTTLPIKDRPAELGHAYDWKQVWTTAGVTSRSEEFDHALQRLMNRTNTKFENNIVALAPRDRRHLH
jgi:hypothetical protein